jgi:acetyl-CoA synthetase
MQAKDLMTQDYISVDKNDVLSKLLGKFITKKQKEAVIVDGNKYAGIVSKTSILDSRIAANKVKIKKYLKDVHKLDRNSELKRACEYMVLSDSHTLPILYEDGRIEGVVFAKDLIKELKSHAKGYKVKDIERTGLVTLEHDAAIGKAISILRHNKISHILIVDNFGYITGLLSTIDILDKFMLFPSKRQGSDNAKNRMGATRKERNLMNMPVGNYMSKNIAAVSEDEELTNAIDIMLNKGISDVVVTKGKEPVGIITVKDILRLFSVV